MVFNIFNTLDYREITRNLSKEKGISFKSLAAAARIHTSYFSRVLAGDADFSPSQLYHIGRNLGLGEDKLEYFLILGDYSRAGDQQLQSYIKPKIEKIQKEKLKTISELEEDVETEFSEDYVREYYQESITAKIHMYLTLEKYRTNPNLILSKVFIPDYKLGQELDKLERIGVLRRNEEGKIKLLKYNVHLDEASPLIANTHINWRLETISHLNKRNPRPSDHHISAVFTTDEQGKLKIKDLFKKFVANAQRVASEHHENEDVFHICFDLY